MHNRCTYRPLIPNVDNWNSQIFLSPVETSSQSSQCYSQCLIWNWFNSKEFYLVLFIWIKWDPPVFWVVYKPGPDRKGCPQGQGAPKRPSSGWKVPTLQTHSINCNGKVPTRLRLFLWKHFPSLSPSIRKGFRLWKTVFHLCDLRECVWDLCSQLLWLRMSIFSEYYAKKPPSNTHLTCIHPFYFWWTKDFPTKWILSSEVIGSI